MACSPAQASRKTVAQQQKWGGTAGAPFDPCYHRACDTTANVADTPLNTSADAIAYVLWTLAAIDDFSLSVTPSQVTLEPGTAATVTVGTSVTAGDPQQVALRAAELPPGITVTFTPPTIQSGNSSTLTVEAAPSTADGTTTLTITGDGVDVDHTTPLRLTISGGDPPGCTAAAWLASAAYVPGDVVSHNNHEWESLWYSTGAEPGAPNSWAAWRDSGTC